MTREEARGNLIHAIRWNDMPKKEALEIAIKALEQQTCEDAVSREAAIDALKQAYWNKDMQNAKDDPCIVDAMTDWAIRTIKDLPSVNPQHTDVKIQKMQELEQAEIQKAYELGKAEDPNKWIPVKWHEITDEEREREGYPKEWACHLDSIMPYDGQRILITTRGGYVELDECYSDDGCTFSLDSGYDWVDDVVAWCELPEPYKAESEG